MNLRKTVFSYIILGLFILFSAFCVFGTLESAGFSQMFGWTSPVLVGIACLYLLLAVAVFTALRTLIWEIGKHITDKKRAEKVFQVVLPVLVILGAAVYLIVYLMHHIPIALDNDTFYRMALVREEKDVVSSARGLSGLYVRLLHGMLLIFGNTPFAGAVLQMILFFICLVLLYVGMRAYAGAFPAAVSTALLGFSPISMDYVFSLTPELFYLVLYLFGFCLTGFLHQKFFRQSTVFSGLYLLLFPVGVYGGFLFASNVSRGAENPVFHGKDILQMFHVPDYSCVAFLLLISLAFFVVPVFFIREKGQNSAFILNLFLLCGLSWLGAEGLSGNSAAVLGWCMLAGCGICGMISPAEKTAEKESVKPAPGEPLHNPLPVPKKKSRPQADFGFEVKDEDMKFDVEVSENDDFDL